MNKSIFQQSLPASRGRLATFALSAALFTVASAHAQQTPLFTQGNLVVLVEGCGVYGGTCTAVANGTGAGTGNSSIGGYGDNQGAPLTLFQFAPVGTTSASYVNSLVLPQSASGANLPVSSEYGSSSEGTLQLSGSGKYLSFAGYGIGAATFDANPANYGALPSLALAQSGSLTGQTYTPVARVIALVDAFGNVNSSTALFNIYNTNNPRSVYTLDGTTTAYISGQGSGSDATGGVFYTPLNITNTAPTPITGLDTTNGSLSQDTRDVQVVNNTLYFSVDSKEGSGSARSYVGTLGTIGTLPTAAVSAPVMLNGYGNTGGTGKVSITTGPNSNGNAFNGGLQINTSPNNFFFANASTLYVADTGNPKNNSATSLVGDGGLQKWINTKPDGSGAWSLAYTLYQGLGLVLNTSGTGSSGLYGLTGMVVGNAVELFATDSTLSDLDPTHLFGITDAISYTMASQASSESFTLLATAPSDSNFKGVSFAPMAPVQTTPTITWAAPASIVFGSALSGEQLNATASVPGTFTYTPAPGTVLPAGVGQTLSVSFTPTDPTDYTSASGSTAITVNPAPTATPASLVATRILTRSATNITVQITVANTGGTAALNVTLTSVKVGTALATPLPMTMGAIPAGGSATANVVVPASAGASGAASSLAITGTYTGGTFSSSARITLP